MNSRTDTSAALACVPGAIAAAERPTHFERLRDLFDNQVLERIDLDDGFSWRFPPEALSELSAFVSLERRCCPFLRFRIDVHPDGGPVWLTIEGPSGTRSFLEDELALAGTSTGVR